MSIVLGRLLRWAARFVVRLVVVLIALEVVLRATLWWKGSRMPIERDPHIGWRLKPHLRQVFTEEEALFLVETNSRGRRDDEVRPRQKRGMRRIIGLGESTAFGTGVDETEAFYTLLERLLPRTEVVNFASIGLSADQHYRLLHDEGFALEPDVVVQLVVNSDIREPFVGWSPLLGPKCRLVSREGRPEIEPPRAALWSSLVQSSRLAEVGMLSVISTVLAVRPDFDIPPPVPLDERAQALAALLLQTQRACRQHGCDHVLVYLPSMHDVQPDREPERASATTTARLLRRLRDSGHIVLLDTTQALREAMRGAEAARPFGGNGHYLNAAGHRLVAELLAQFLAERAGGP